MSMHFSLQPYGITVDTIYRNLTPGELYEYALRYDAGSAVTSTGALVAMSGEKTGRSPLDKRVIREASSEQDIWWGKVNIGLDENSFNINRERAIDYLNTREHLYCVDAFAGWEPKYRIKVRVICARPYHALFMHNMLIRPTDEQLARFGEPDYVIFNAGGFPGQPLHRGDDVQDQRRSQSRTRRVRHPRHRVRRRDEEGRLHGDELPDAEAGRAVDALLRDRGRARRSSVLFGLSGTGKTTLSADPNRMLIGDDEHCWTDDGIFNIEGGCYAKVIDLSAEARAADLRCAALRCRAGERRLRRATHHVDFDDTSITENTRGAYPIEYIDNAKIPCVAGHPDNVIFLTCDAFGVLPPVSQLTPEQAMYHFISGYTAKVAGTEVGVTEPQATFSPCFGGPFLVWHPTATRSCWPRRSAQHDASTWLVNTGWSRRSPLASARGSSWPTRARSSTRSTTAR